MIISKKNVRNKMVKQLLLLAEKSKYILQNLGCSKSSRVFMLREHTSKQILPFINAVLPFSNKGYILYVFANTCFIQVVSE